MNTINLTKENFDSIITQNELVVIDFWAEWCAPCKAFEPIYAEVASQYPDILFAKVNTEAQAELAADFNIRSIPTLVILRQKIMVFFESGLLPASAMHDLIKQAKALDMGEVLKELQEASKE
jgi:thioredoxin 1